MDEQLKQQLLATSDVNERYTLCNESSFIYGRIKDYQECNNTQLRNRVKYVDTYYKDIVRKINNCLIHKLYDNFSNSVLYNTRLYCHFSKCKVEFNNYHGVDSGHPYYKIPFTWTCNREYDPDTRTYETRVYMNEKWLKHFKNWLAEHLKNMKEKLEEKVIIYNKMIFEAKIKNNQLKQEKQKQKEEKIREKEMKLQEKEQEKQKKKDDKKLEMEKKLQEKKLEKEREKQMKLKEKEFEKEQLKQEKQKQKEEKEQEKQKKKQEKLEEQKIYQSVKHLCCCGGTYIISHLSTHNKTRKHMMHIMNDV